MKKLLIVAILVFSAAQIVTAQVPGYLGKRFLVGASGGAVYNLTNPNPKLNEGITAFSFSGGVSGEYVLSRDLSIGLRADYSKTGMDYQYENLTFEEGAQALSIIQAGFFMNVYSYSKRGSIAPLGSYFTYGLNWFSYTPSYPEGTVLNDPSFASDNWKRLHGFHLYLGFGKKWLIKERFMPELQLLSGLYMTSYTFKKDPLAEDATIGGYGSSGSTPPEVANEAYYRNISASRLLQYGLFQVKIGCAILLF